MHSLRLSPEPEEYKCGRYDAIISDWHPYCKEYYEENKEKEKEKESDKK